MFQPPSDTHSAMDTKETEGRKYKPPPGAFVLPTVGGGAPKPKLSPIDKSSTQGDNKSGIFEKPALKTVKPRGQTKQPNEDSETGSHISRKALFTVKSMYFMGYSVFFILLVV